ncbi:hypothetical protein Pan153_57390 [Gimesia panareensis]|uniref:Protein-glutamine gamma-glutamyltransferase-like C-terminal domain-containing protein n=1 Tax=Gimesia panareensis TaxID=2527978 RepID=A0A518FXE7_9PLAN|nr:DUF4129 domain-containing protein [Gimesia panareensis]QDV21057.1 hypothetical protein Pan153_57390 [Gimesia panareensis]
MTGCRFRFLIIAARLLILASPLLLTSIVAAQPGETQSADLSSPDQVMLKQDMQEILKRPEFRHLTRERQLTKDADVDLDDWIKDSPRQSSYDTSAISGAAGALFMFLSYASVVCACVLVLFLLYKAVVGFKYSKENKMDTAKPQLQGEMVLEENVSPAEFAAATYLERAQELAKAGDYHKAIIQLLYGSMSFIERSGWIRFRKGLTYRDYLRAARPHGLPGESLRQMIRTYEPLGFGRRVATREHFESTLQLYESAFQKKT